MRRIPEIQAFFYFPSGLRLTEDSHRYRWVFLRRPPVAFVRVVPLAVLVRFGIFDHGTEDA